MGLLQLCSPTSKSNNGTFPKKWTMTSEEMTKSPLDFRHEEIACQLTLIDLDIFKQIRPDELTSCAWNKRSKHEVAPNVVKFTQRFNHVSFWVIEEILKPSLTRDLAEILTHFIHVAKKCHDLNNLHTEYAIISALQSASIFRLKKTWNLLSKREKSLFDKLYEFFSRESNFEKLRKHLDLLALTSKDCIPYLGLYLTDLIHIDSIHPHTGGLESNQRRVKMNNILRILSEMQQSTYAYIPRNNECQTYLRSLRYIEELQKFVEDNQWKRSLAIEPNQLKPDLDHENQDVLGHLNLSPSKMSAREHASHVDRPFVPGHRRAKSDGCGMFMMKHKETFTQDAYKANYSHHLLDDSKLEESENVKSPSHTLPNNFSTKKGSLERGNPENGVMKLIRNPGIKCQHQGLVKRRSLIKDGNRPILTMWKRYWMQIWGDALVLYATRLFSQGETREHFRHDPCKYVTVAGWHILVDVNSLTKEFSFQLTDPIRRNVYQFRTENSEETNLWLHHLNIAVNVNNINKRSSKNLMSFD